MEDRIKHLEAIIAEMEDRTGELPDWLAGVTSWTGFIDAAGAEALLGHNVRPEKGKKGTNRPQVSGAIPQLIEDILGAEWRFNHQGIAFNEHGELIDGQHRLEAIVRADKIAPGIEVPLMITWNLPVISDEKIDLARRRNTGTFLAKDGYGASSRLNTILKLLYLYDTANFDEPINKAHWGQIPNLAQIRASLEAHPMAEDACAIGGSLQTFVTASAAGAAWVIAREKYPEEMNMEFVAGVKSGANLDIGDPRLALRNWAVNRKTLGRKAVAPLHMAAYLKAFSAYRQNKHMSTLVFKESVERFPRP